MHSHLGGIIIKGWSIRINMDKNAWQSLDTVVGLLEFSLPVLHMRVGWASTE